MLLEVWERNPGDMEVKSTSSNSPGRAKDWGMEFSPYPLLSQSSWAHDQGKVVADTAAKRL